MIFNNSLLHNVLCFLPMYCPENPHLHLPVSIVIVHISTIDDVSAVGGAVLEPALECVLPALLEHLTIHCS